MAKRPFHAEHEADQVNGRKKVKLRNGTSTEDERPINSVGSLKALLTFHQDDVAQYRINLQSFRRYLENLCSLDNANSMEDGILFQYLNGSINTTNADQLEIIPDIFQAWRYAVQVYDEGLVPTIPSVLSTLLRTISSSVKFIEVGCQICRTLMRRENVQLLQKSMNSTRTRDTTIARCLDLLTEVVSFDGGSCAKGVWLQRGTTMSRLPHLISMSKKAIYGVSQSTSVRDHAIPFLLANLRYQDLEAKADILSNRKTVQNMLREILSEPTSIVKSILSTIKQYVVEDQNLGRSAKGHLLTDLNLGYILAVMRYGEENDDWTSLKDLAQDVLIVSCTSRAHGILYRQNGWYPPGTEEVTLKEDIQFFGGTVDTGDSIKYKDRVPVRNTTLAAFIQDLKPWASVPERKLMLGIFEASPELIADYFSRKKAFSFEPKLTITWIGWATFICSAIRLSPPTCEKYLDGKIRQPPPLPVILQSILPQPLTSQALDKAIKQQSEIIKLFTMKILIAAFGKLKLVLDEFQAASSPSVWQAAAAGLLQEFHSICPDYRSVLNLYQSLTEDKHILRETTASLLSLYHTVAPQFVLDTKFDVSSSITKMLNRVVTDGEQSNESTLLELHHLLSIGSCVIEAKWWHKTEHATVSTLTIMLKLLTSTKLNRNKNLKTLVKGILEDSFVINPSHGVESLDVLLESLQILKKSSAEDIIYSFLDDCFIRLTRKPVKYHGDARDLAREYQNESMIEPMFMVLLEQWPFFVKSHTILENTACVEWICAYLVGSARLGRSIEQLDVLHEQFRKGIEEKEIERIFKNSKSSMIVKPNGQVSNGLEHAESPPNDLSNSSDTIREAELAAFDTRLSLPKEPENYPVLVRWQGKPIQEAVMDGHITNLIYCLISSYQEIRVQAAAALKLLMINVQASKYEERQSLYLLLGTLQETISQNGTSAQLPSNAVSLAARSVKVLSNPLNPMYAKINHFLSRSPSWNLAKLSSYWMDKIFNKPATQMDAHWKEVDWLLDTLLDGLRNADDTNLYRRTGVFERILVNCTTTNAPKSIYEKLIDILYRCALIGGATTLVTRFGILAWIASQKLVNPKFEPILSTLETKIRRVCDAKRVHEWSHGNIRCDKDQNGIESNNVQPHEEDYLDAYERLNLLSKPVPESADSGKAGGSIIHNAYPRNGQDKLIDKHQDAVVTGGNDDGDNEEDDTETETETDSNSNSDSDSDAQ